MAIVKYLVKREDIPLKAMNKGTNEPIVLLGSNKRPLYLFTIGTFAGDIFISVFAVNEKGKTEADLAVLEQKINNLISVNTELERIITKYTNYIDSDEEELEESSSFVCDNPECSEHLIQEAIYLDGEYVCPMCGEPVREIFTDTLEELDYDRLKEIASILILELMEKYKVSSYEMETIIGIDPEEIEYITAY